MQVDAHINGGIAINLRPDSELQKQILQELLAAAERGEKVKIRAFAGSGVSIVVENVRFAPVSEAAV